jgi:hypothetical protein
MTFAQQRSHGGVLADVVSATSVSVAARMDGLACEINSVKFL